MHAPLCPIPFTLRPADDADRAFCYHLVFTTLPTGPELGDEQAAPEPAPDQAGPEAAAAEGPGAGGSPPDPRTRFDTLWPTDLLPFTRIIQVLGHPVGQLVTYADLARVFVKDLELLPPWQSRGIGTAVLALLAAEADPRPLELKVNRSNPRAHAFYIRLNFTLIESTATYHLLRLPPSPQVQRSEPAGSAQP